MQMIYNFMHYLIPIEIHTPLRFAPLICASPIFAYPQISCPFNFRAPLFQFKFAGFFIHSLHLFFSLWLIPSYCANLLPLIFAHPCAKIEGARTNMGIRYCLCKRHLDGSLQTERCIFMNLSYCDYSRWGWVEKMLGRLTPH